MTTCHRAFETDVPAFVRDPRAAEWNDFRDHYPRCSPCTAEVRAWTELHDALDVLGGPTGDGAHPSEDTLLRFAERREDLAPAERDAVARHVHACRPCRDELAALARFDFAALTAREPTTAPARQTRSFVDSVRRALASVRHVALHPAFAYALVVLLLVPTLARRSTQVAKPDEAARAASPAKIEAPALTEPASEGQVTAPPAQRFARERVVDSADGDNAALLDLAGTLRPNRGGESWPVVALASDQRPTIVAATLAEGARLAIPLPESAPADADVQVTLIGPDDMREVRERIPVSEHATTVEMRVPVAWLNRGTYRVSLDYPPRSKMEREADTIASTGGGGIAAERRAPASVGASPAADFAFVVR